MRSHPYFWQFALIAFAFLPSVAFAQNATFEFSDLDGTDNGITADLLIGSTQVATATIVRSNVTNFGANPNIFSGASTGAGVFENGQENAIEHSVTYQVSIDNVTSGFQFDGFQLRQFEGSTGPVIANPNYSFTFNTGTGSTGVLTDPDGTFIGGSGSFGSGDTLFSVGSDNLDVEQVDDFRIDLDSSITDFTLTYETATVPAVGQPNQVNFESLFLEASFVADAVVAVPEPSSLALLAFAASSITLIRRKS